MNNPQAMMNVRHMTVSNDTIEKYVGIIYNNKKQLSKLIAII